MDGEIDDELRSADQQRPTFGPADHPPLDVRLEPRRRRRQPREEADKDTETCRMTRDDGTKRENMTAKMNSTIT